MEPEEPNGTDFAAFGKRLVAVSLVVLLVVFAFVVYRSLNKSWNPVLAPYVGFVEAERGLEFTQPVDLRWANIAEEIDADRPVVRVDTDFVDPWSEAYRLLGLVDPEPDISVDQAINDTLSENAGAFYEPWSETIVLPEGVSEIELSFTIVHELTHALQHQHGMLGGNAFETADDVVARRALIEGDAERIALAWFWDQPESVRNDYLEAVGYDHDTVAPDPGDNYLAASFFASYEIGTPMVEAIIEAEGVEAINALLRAKKVGTTERLVDVLGNDERSSVDAIADMTLPDGAEEAVGDLGALTWFHTLGPILGTENTFEALIGYDDDAFAVYESNGQSCARFSVFFESGAEAAAFVDALNAANVGGQLALAGNEATLDACEPIGDPADQRFGTIMPLVVAHQSALAHLQDGESVEVARCAGIAQASTIPANQSINDFVGWEQIYADRVQFLDGCT